jgi:hypothetical protein
MPHAGTSAAFLMGRAVGAEYRFESISWGDAPGWDDTGALPLKRIRNFGLWIMNYGWKSFTTWRSWRLGG